MALSRHRRSRVRPALVLCVALLAALLPEGVAAAPPAQTVKAIVTFADTPRGPARDAVKGAGGTVRHAFKSSNSLAIQVPAAALDGLRKNKLVSAVELDGKLTAFDHGPDTGDLEYENAWGVEHIGSKAVHDAGIKGNGVKVAIIDTGLDYIHDDPDDSPYVVDPEFQLGDNYAGGFDFFNNDTDPYDDNGHGTHVAGILGAQKNGYLVAGVAPQAEIYALKVLDATGNGDYSGLIAALEWSVANGIDVVNMSLGGHEVSAALQSAVEYAADNGIVLVAASGNVVTIQELFAGCPVAYPAAYPDVLSTTFTNPNDALTGFSCTGPQVDFASPGDNVISTVPTGACMFCTPQGYSAQSGTSMASPHLAGTAALLIDAGLADTNAPGLIDDIKATLCATTNPGWGVQSIFGSSPITPADPRYPSWFGCGVIDTDEAVFSVTPPPPGNGPPVAAADDASTSEDTAVDIAVLGNDSDPDGDPLSVVSLTDPAKGSASINPNGTVHYAPDANANGDDTFGYTISDGQGHTASATVTVHVGAAGDPPVATDDGATTAEDTATTIAVLGNDTDPDADPLTTTGVTDPPHGSAAIQGNGSVLYTPDANYSGPDSFDYTVSDGTGGSDVGTVSVTVTPVNDAPTAAPKSATTTSPNAVTVTMTGTDVETCNLTFQVVQGPLNGSLSTITNAACVAGSPNADSATVTYTPNAGFVGNEQFTYRTSDGTTTSGTVAVTITVTAAPLPNPFHVGDLDRATSIAGKTWTAKVTIRVESGTHAALSGAIVTGTWSNGGTASCTTNSSGTCTVQKTKLSLSGVASVTFTVTSVTRSGGTYVPGSNHDPDGESNGTAITVNRPGAAAIAAAIRSGTPLRAG